MGVSQMESMARKGDLQQLKDVVRKVFEYTPPAKGKGRKRVVREREVKHRRRGAAEKEPARPG